MYSALRFNPTLPSRVLLCGLLTCELPTLAHAETTADGVVPPPDRGPIRNDVVSVPDAALQPVPGTLQYVHPMPTTGLRAVLELQGIFLTGFLYYVTTSGLDHDWDLNYSWDVFSKKVTGEAFDTDHNHFGTNFVGHPLGGTGYYQAARTNRLGIYESGAMAFAGSLVWEYFGEIREVISFNDTLVTPLAGWAIGESLFQLGSFFDRAGPQLHNRILGGIFGPLKSFNDWADDAQLRRSSSVFPTDEWHHFDLQSSLAVTHEHGTRNETLASGAHAPSRDAVEGRVSFEERLARLPGFDGPGRRSLGFTEANASSMSLSATFGAGGLNELDFRAQAVLAGRYWRDARGSKHRVYGGGGFVGLGMGFDYFVHDWRRNEAGQVDRISSVTPVDVVLAQRVDAGDAHLDAYVDVGPNFGGVRSLALDRVDADTLRLPDVTELHGYYFGFGGHARAAVRAVWRALEVEGGAYIDGFRALREPNSDTRMVDTRGKFDASIGYRIADGPWRVRGTLDHALRGSSAGDAHSFERETSLGLATAAVF